MSRTSFLTIAVSFSLLLTLSGCVSTPSSTDSSDHFLLDAIANQFTIKRDAEIFASAERKGNEVVVTVTVHNVSQKPIQSVQSWLSYDPRQLKGKSISVSDSPFNLTAPYENNFDDDRGLVRLGRASSQPVTDARISVAQITFEVLTKDVTMLSFYDYQLYLTGHTSVNMLVSNTPYNVLQQPRSPAVVIR